MLKSAEIVSLVIFLLEAAVIITGNMFTIFVFWTQRTHLRRTCVLLINLAVADLLVGITEPIVLGTEKIPRMKAPGPMEEEKRMKNPSSAFQVLGSSTSVIFLALISLERAHAVLRPLRHRVLKTRVYIWVIVIAWTAGLCIAGAQLLAMYHTEVDSGHTGAIIHSFLFLSVLIICRCYLKIRTRLHPTTPVQLELNKHKSAEHYSRLSRTFFIVAALSLMFWLPAIIVYTVMDFCRKQCELSPPVVSFVNCLHLANSMVNPFVYCFRMRIFKNALKKCCDRRLQDIDSAVAHFNVKKETVESNSHL